MRLVAGGKQVHGSADGLLDRADGLAGVRAVAQHGGGEDVGAHAVEVTRALQVPGEHVDRAGDAFRGEFARINVGRKPRHHFVVDDASEVLAGDGLLFAYVVLRVEDDEAHRIRPQVDHAVICHSAIRFLLSSVFLHPSVAFRAMGKSLRVLYARSAWTPYSGRANGRFARAACRPSALQG